MKDIRKFSSILLAILLTLSLLPAISFAQELAVLPETPDKTEAIGDSAPHATPSPEVSASPAPSTDQAVPSPTITDGIAEESSPQKSPEPESSQNDPAAPVEEPVSEEPEHSAHFQVDGSGAAPMSVLTGDGYSYDATTQTLNVEDASKTAWKSDGNLTDWQAQITTVNLPDGSAPSAARTLADGMFNGCSGLKTVNNLEFATGFSGGNTFSYCTNLTSVTLPASGCELPGAIFAGCTSLEAVNNLDKVTNFAGSQHFIGCSNLVEVTLPVGAKLTLRMFADCTRLTAVNNLDKVAQFQDSQIFAGCTGLQEVTLPIGATLSSQMFIGCTSLKIVNNLDQAAGFNGVRTFAECSGLIQVTLPDVVYSDYMFFDCTGLMTANLPVGADLSRGMFAGCSSLTTVANLDTAASFKNDTTNDIGTFERCASLQSVTLPNIAYANYMFYNCGDLATVNLPVGASLSRGMFAKCSALTTVNNLASAAAFANDTDNDVGTFEECTSLEEVTLPNVSYANYMFHLSGVKTVNLPVGATLSGRMFRSCTELTTVNNLDRVSVFNGSSIFKGCTSLKNVSLPPGTVIPGTIFEDCTALETVIGLEGASGFSGDSQFAGCSNLTTVSLPSGKSVPASIFEGCTMLEIIGNIINAPSFGSDALKGCAFDFTSTAGYPSSLTANLASCASQQLPKVYFARSGSDSASVSVGTTFTPPYTLTTKSGSDYAQMVTDKAGHSSWLNQSVTAPAVTTTAFDSNTPGVYTVNQSIPATVYANTHALAPFTLTVQGAPTVGTVSTPASFPENTVPSLTVPSLNENYAAITAQGWQIKRTADSSFANYTAGMPLDASYNGALLRYFAQNSVGTGYSNEVTLSMYIHHALIHGDSSISYGQSGIWQFNGNVSTLTDASLTHESGTVYPFSIQPDQAAAIILYNGTIVGSAEGTDVAITLYADYLNSLPAGNYALQVVFDDGTISGQGEAQFTLNNNPSPSASPSPSPSASPTASPSASPSPTPSPSASPTPSPSTSPTSSPSTSPTPSPSLQPTPSSPPPTAGGGSSDGSNSSAPPTGDAQDLPLWFTLCGLSAAGIIVLTLLFKLRKSNK